MTVYTGRNFSTKIVSGNVTVSLMSYPRKPSDLPSLHMRKKDIKKKKTVIICFLLNMKLYRCLVRTFLHTFTAACSQWDIGTLFYLFNG